MTTLLFNTRKSYLSFLFLLIRDDPYVFDEFFFLSFLRLSHQIWFQLSIRPLYTYISIFFFFFQLWFDFGYVREKEEEMGENSIIQFNKLHNKPRKKNYYNTKKKIQCPHQRSCFIQFDSSLVLILPPFMFINFIFLNQPIYPRFFFF